MCGFHRSASVCGVSGRNTFTSARHALLLRMTSGTFCTDLPTTTPSSSAPRRSSCQCEPTAERSPAPPPGLSIMENRRKYFPENRLARHPSDQMRVLKKADCCDADSRQATIPVGQFWWERHYDVTTVPRKPASIRNSEKSTNPAQPDDRTNNAAPLTLLTLAGEGRPAFDPAMSVYFAEASRL